MNNMEKIIIVTGGTGNLGRVIVKYLANFGHKIYVPARNLENFNKIFDNSQTSDEFKLSRIYSLECNASDLKSVREFISSVVRIENHKLDVLINTVGGIHTPVNITDSDDNVFDDIINLNLRSAYYFSKEASKIMKKNFYGRIISISSLASLKVSPKLFYYSMTKNAINSLMNTMSAELKEFNIKCNTIIPGTIDTPPNREWGKVDDIKKWVTPESIAKIIQNLISDDFDDVHSSEIKVLGKL
jgi:2-dehydro-3-deoxy-D-gluconate 5-dehydrogenase